MYVWRDSIHEKLILEQQCKERISRKLMRTKQRKKQELNQQTNKKKLEETEEGKKNE